MTIGYNKIYIEGQKIYIGSAKIYIGPLTANY